MNKRFLRGLTATMLPLSLCSSPTQATGSYTYQGSRNARKSVVAESAVKGTKLASALLPMQQRPLKKLGDLALISNNETNARLQAPIDLNVFQQSLAANSELQIVGGNPIRELIIIDHAVPDKHVFYQQLKPGVEVKEIKSGKNGLIQLTQILSQYQNLDALHLVSHADDGVIYLGDSQVTENVLRNEINTLSALDNALNDGADLLLYGCNLAQGEKGEALLELIANEANVDVAASNDFTGSTGENVDWDLEIHSGNINSELPFSKLALQNFSSLLSLTSMEGNDFCAYPAYCSNTVAYGGINLTGSFINGSNSLYSTYMNGGLTNAGGYGVYLYDTSGTTGSFTFEADGSSLQSFTLDSLVLENAAYSCDIEVKGYKASDGLALAIDTATLSGRTVVTLTNTSSVQVTKFKISATSCTGNVFYSFGVAGFTLSNRIAPSPNSAPTISGAPTSVTVTEDVQTNIDLSAVIFDDAEGDPLTVTLIADAGTIASAGGDGPFGGVTIAGSGTSTMTLAGSIANIHSYLDTVTNIKYTTAANDTTTSNLAVKANDGIVDSSTSTITISITNIADITSDSVPVNGTFSDGANLDFSVSFDESVTVTGTPRISLDIGGTPKFATYISGSPGTTLSFRYTIESGLNDTDGITVTNTIDPNGGTIKDTDGDGSGADLTNISFASTTGVLVDALVPMITNVAIANSAHKVGDSVTATITVSSDTDNYTLGSGINGTINNYALGGLVKINDTTYTAKFTIADGGTDVLAGSDVAVSFTLNDSSGNTSAAFTTAINRTNDAIYANLPNINLTSSSGTIAEDGGIATLTGTISGSLNNQWPTPITVNLAYTGTAAPITDFTKSNSFIINALSSSGSTTVTGVADTHYDAASAESIVVDIDSLSQGSEGTTSQQIINITDAELAPTVTLSTGSASIAENGGTSSITAALSNPTYADVTVNLAYSGSAATDGSDYATPSNSITINALSLNNSAATGITAVNDASADGDLDILIDVDSVIGGSATENAVQQQTVSIIDDDDLTPPTLTGSTPSHNAVNIAISNPVISLTFDEKVQAGTGNISLILLSDSSIVQALAIAGPDVSMVDKVITANFSTTLLPQGQYGVRIDNTTVTDLAGNAYTGLAETDLSFTTFNAVPVSVDDIVTVDEDASVLIDVLNNDNDSEGLLQPSSTTVVTAPLNGQTSINTANGVITYTPNTNYNGSDSLTYTVADQQGTPSAIATVTITVNGINDLPMAVNDLVITAEDTDITFSILDNDSDIDVSGNLAINTIDTATVNIVSSTSSGSLTVVTSAMVIDDPSLSEGQVIYSPNANFNGSDSFTYTVTDTLNSVSNNATATINVTGTNDTPVAVDDTVQTDEDIAVVIEVLSNDSDIEDRLDSTSVREVSAPLHGALTIDAVTGAITYTPEPDFHGSDSFSYSVMDIDNATSNAAMVALTINSINDAPVAVDNTVVLFEYSTKLINALGNDSDVDTALDNSHIIDPTTVVIIAGPASGQVNVNGVSGEISYSPTVNFNGSDSFTYTVKDSANLVSNIATINLTITPINNLPLANDDTANLDEDSSVIIDLLANDQDIDGSLDQSSLVITYNGIACTSSPCLLGFGTVTDNADGTVTYLPNANYVGGDSFSYTIDDNEAGHSNAASVTISVNNVNDAPTIDSAPLIDATEDGELRYTLDGALFSDVDTEDNLTVTVEGLPIWLSFNSDTLTFTGTPTNDDVGDIILTVSVTDGNSDPVSQIFTLTVANQNDAPLAANDTVNRDNWLAVDINVLANDIDVDGDNLIILAASVGSGSVNWTDKLLTYTPVEGFTGSAVIEYQVSDNNGGVDSALVFVDIVVPDNLFPVISVPADIEVNADALATRVDLGVATALDNAGNPLAVSLVDGTTFFQPGVTTAYWQTNDSDGLTSIASQLLKVNPLVSLDKDQTVLEGYAVTVDVHLNGLAPVYPLSIPYSVSGSAEQGVDHDLLDGEVVIESGTEGSIRFNVLSDGVFDDQETVVITLSELINLGSNSVHTLTISEQNIAPAVELTVSQAGSERFVVNLEDGTVVVEAEVIHPDLANQYSYKWSNVEQLLTDSDNLDASFSFEPAGLAVGIYHLELLVTDLDDPTFSGSEQVTMLLEQSPIVLTDSDSDADGIPDNVEGLADTDSDGIPDYLDAISECNVIQESLDSSNDFLVEGDPGVCLRLGDLALAGTTGGTRIIDATTEDPDATNTGGIFDFIAYELPEAGQTYQIVLPQLQPIPANPIYRKTNSDGLWVDFAETTTDQLWSVAGEPGYCPPPGDDSWEPRLVEGYWCVQLTIKDGGENDADGLANNTIVDPGGVAVAVSGNNQPVATDDVAQTRLDTPLTLDVLGNDTDIDGNTLVINSANAVFGSVSIVDNQLYYEPTSGFFGVDTIVYGISDGQGGSNSATLTVTVVVNQAPVAVNDIAHTVSGQHLIIAVLGNDSDPEGDSIVVITASAENGSMTINTDNTLSYVSDSGFTGTDTISYRIRDAFGAETSGQVEVTVATAISTVKLKNSGGGALIWLLLIGFSLLTYRQVTNKVKGTR